MPTQAETPHGQHEIVPADRRLRTWTILAAVLLCLAGLVVIGVLHNQLQAIEKPPIRRDMEMLHRWEAEHLQVAKERAIRLTAIVAWIGGLGFVGTGAWFWWLGRRINRADRFPPPGMKVIKDTPVRSGPGARRLANLAQLTALLCVVVGTIGMWYLYQLAVTVSW